MVEKRTVAASMRVKMGINKKKETAEVTVIVYNLSGVWVIQVYLLRRVYSIFVFFVEILSKTKLNKY